jgi:hypothetical protein
MIYFCHVERTGGTSIHSYFAKYFAAEGPVRSGAFIPGRAYFVVSGPHELGDACRLVQQLPDRRFYMGGHVGLHHLQAEGIEIADSDVVFTLVRDPVERAVSLYYLLQRGPEWFGEAAFRAAGWGFEYFYCCIRDLGLFHNDHCRLIANSESFETTIACIKRYFNLVGASSRIYSIEKGLEQLCGPIVPDFRISRARENAAWHEQNVSGEWVRKTAIDHLVSARLHDRIVRENEADMMLVDFVERIHGGLFLRDPHRI